MLTGLCADLETLAGEGTIEQVHLVESRGALYTVDLTHQLFNFRLDVSTICGGQGTVLTFNCQFVHSLQHILNFA